MESEECQRCLRLELEKLQDSFGVENRSSPDTDGSNWPLWQATMRSFFESKNLIKHIEGTAARPLPPPTFAATHTITDEEDACIERAEERMEKFLARAGLVKSQVLCSNT